MLALALLLGLLRFAGLGTWSLWLDEALTLADAKAHGWSGNPLGYRLFGWIYDRFPARPDEWGLRLPAAVAGLLVLASMWWCWRPLASARARALAILFVAASAWELYWSQNARFYTVAQLLALWGGTLVVVGACAGSATRLVLGYATLALGAATHPSVAFWGAALLLAPWALRVSGRWEARTRALWRTSAALLVVALVLGFGWAREVWTRWEANKGTANPLHFALTFGYSVTPLLALAWLVGGWRTLRAGPLPARTVTAASVLTLALASGASLVSRMSAQYVFALLPWLALGAAWALEGLRARTRWSLAALVTLPMLVESALYLGVRHGDRPRWREAYELVMSRRRPEDLLLGMEAPVGEYYLDPRKTDLREWSAVGWLDAYRPRLYERWMRYRRPVWLILNPEQLADWPREEARALRAFVEQSCSLEASLLVPWTPRDLDVLVYRWPGSP